MDFLGNNRLGQASSSVSWDPRVLGISQTAGAGKVLGVTESNIIHFLGFCQEFL